MWFLSPCVALAGTVLFDASVPVDVFHGSAPIARLYVAGRVSVELPMGPQQLRVWTDGDPHDVKVDVPEHGQVTVVIADTGITTNTLPNEIAGVVGPVEFRVAGNTVVTILVDDQRLRLGPGDALKLDLADGPHKLGVRDASGTLIWARGTLEVKQPRGLVVQLSAGHMPEVAGTGGSFVPDGG